MADQEANFTQENIQTKDGIAELNRQLNQLQENSGTSGSFFFNFKKGLDLTIATGVITVTNSRHLIDTESAAATDDLDTINGGEEGDLLIISALDSARTVVVKDGTGNISSAGDFSMDHADDRIVLINDGTQWVEISRSGNA